MSIGKRINLEMKPRVFIGSSSEGRDFAYALQENLESDAEVTVWDQDIFSPMKSFLDSLLVTLNYMDFGVFIFSPDDSLRMRGQETLAARDNVIFELGLFVGRFGPQRSIFVVPKGVEIRIPSDLLGIMAPAFDANRKDQNWRAALGPASNQIRKLLKRFEKEQEEDNIHRIPAELEVAFFRRRTLISNLQQNILAFIEARRECSFALLKKHFPRMKDGELHYRLEQLRLLMFIQILDEPVEADSLQERRYGLSDVYQRVYESNRGLRTPGSQIAPNDSSSTSAGRKRKTSTTKKSGRDHSSGSKPAQ